MKIENQFCLPEQSKKLFDLGITESEFSWYKSDKEYLLAHLLDRDAIGLQGKEILPAFTVGELGEMLPNEAGKLVTTTSYNQHAGQWECRTDEFYEGMPAYHHSTTGQTEAEARAELLIDLLESKDITSDEVNKRLTEA